MTIGILAVQGAFIEHINMLSSLGVRTKEIRQAEDLTTMPDGLILPGGESSVMGKLLVDLDLLEPLKTQIQQGLPVFGTCAGMILLAQDVDGSKKHFATMDIRVVRNAYGRQLGSFCVRSSFAGEYGVEMPFIRAPYMQSVGADVEVLSVVDGKIVAARQKNQLVTAFHPELTKDTSIHKYFLNMIMK